ncbi:MAG TPA: hypothetical protein P5180_12940 [Bacteroidales bacterium]|nr:hypothetical protein [Bacteroidales bacterium]
MKPKVTKGIITSIFLISIFLNLKISIGSSQDSSLDREIISKVEYAQSEANKWWIDSETTPGTAADCWCDPFGCYEVWCDITVYWTVCYSNGPQDCEPSYYGGGWQPWDCEPSGSLCES